MKILIINSGSSSLKYQLIDMHNEEVLAKGNCDRIGLDGMQKHESKDLGSFKVERKMDTHAQAAQVVIDTLTMGEYAVIRLSLIHIYCYLCIKPRRQHQLPLNVFQANQ